MAATGTPTTNIGLRRPQGTDPASIDDINYNSEVIDTKLGAVGSTSVQEQINTLNSKIVTGTMVIACNAGKTQVPYANLPSGKPDSQGKFLQSLYQCVNHTSAAEMTTVCIDGADLIIQTATAQNVTIRWFYFGTV